MPPATHPVTGTDPASLGYWAGIQQERAAKRKGARNSAATRDAQKQQRATRIRQAATDLLADKKAPKDIPGIIEGKDDFGSRPTILEALKTHPSGHWPGRSKKRKAK